MTPIFYTHGDQQIAEWVAPGQVLHSAGEVFEVLVGLSYHGTDKVILHRKNLAPEFFDLKTGMLGEVLQKCVNYRIRLAIIGDFSDLASESFEALVSESNRGRQTFFVENVEVAKQRLFGR